MKLLKTLPSSNSVVFLKKIQVDLSIDEVFKLSNADLFSIKKLYPCSFSDYSIHPNHVAMTNTIFHRSNPITKFNDSQLLIN